MRGSNEPIFNRVITVDDIEQYDVPTNTIKKGSQPDAMLTSLGEGESVIDTENDRVLIKKDGKFYKQVVSDTDIKLEEV